ncbi:hypothetical protein HNY73_011114 [Argiope bruennichi]|uniref:Uncharacterized protein n=1 Tax=Argiope bruennichi TaxID=94029 RepID=A0A8T0F340_ARGBR|nr:hypothetical protein HNY73_011114 [Argiope bruennichi]
MTVSSGYMGDALEFRRFFIWERSLLFTANRKWNAFKSQLRKVLRNNTIEWQNLMSITSWLKVVQFVAGKFLSSYVREKFRVLKLFRNCNAKLLLKCDIINSLQHPGDVELHHVVIREAVERGKKMEKISEALCGAQTIVKLSCVPNPVEICRRLEKPLGVVTKNMNKREASKREKNGSSRLLFSLTSEPLQEIV